MSSLQAVSSAEPAAVWLARSDVLAVLELDEAGVVETDPRHANLGLKALGPTVWREIWISRGPIETGQRGDVNFAISPAHMFAWCRLNPRDGETMLTLSRRVYDQLLEFTSSVRTAHPLRFWNIIGDINAGEGDEEVYRLFCRGRHAAFQDRVWTERDYPAATAIGSHGDGLFVALLAGEDPGCHLENPRQLSAYHYPPLYGPRSPSFARATVLPDSRLLLISGTASVVGHASLHAGDVAAQFEEAWRNVLTLGEQAGESLVPKSLRIYLRKACDLERVRECAARRLEPWGQTVPVAYLLGDICRSELLLEIEAVFGPS